MKTRREILISVFTKIFAGVFVLLFPLITSGADLNSLQQQKSELNKDLDAAQNAAKNKDREAKSLSAQISNLDSDIKSTEEKIQQTTNQISNVQSEIDKLSASVDIRKKELDKLKKHLNVLIVELYRFSSRSELESLFLNDKLSESASEEDYVSAVQLQAKYLFDQVDNAKKDLENQKSDQETKKAELDQLKASQNSYIEGAQYQRLQKDQLLGMTKEQEEAYLRQADEADKQLAIVEAQIRQILSSRTRSSDGTFGSGPGVGSRVSRGEYVGTQGSTGFSTGDHVHFEVDLNGPANGYTSPWPYINAGTLSWPLNSFTITQDYWAYWPGAYPSTGDHHMGIDIAGPYGSPVLAPADGLVVLNEYFGGYGHAWAMKVDNGPYVLLGHLR